MTREEVTARLSRMVIENYCGFSYSVSSVNSLINEIYGDLEARTCESCKHASPYDDREDGVFCTHGSIWARQAITYGCNEWKDK